MTLLFGYVGAAMEWGIRPSELGLCQPAEDLAVMAAYVQDKNEMAAWENLQAEKKHKPKGKRKK